MPIPRTQKTKNPKSSRQPRGTRSSLPPHPMDRGGRWPRPPSGPPRCSSGHGCRWKAGRWGNRLRAGAQRPAVGGPTAAVGHPRAGVPGHRGTGRSYSASPAHPPDRAPRRQPVSNFGPLSGKMIRCGWVGRWVRRRSPGCHSAPPPPTTPAPVPLRRGLTAMPGPRARPLPLRRSESPAGRGGIPRRHAWGVGGFSGVAHRRRLRSGPVVDWGPGTARFWPLTPPPLPPPGTGHGRH